jgi:hypothetical protein
MVRTILLLASLCCFAISGCVLRGPELIVRTPVEVKPEPAGKSFCPPGQAKKGNC